IGIWRSEDSRPRVGAVALVRLRGVDVGLAHRHAAGALLLRLRVAEGLLVPEEVCVTESREKLEKALALLARLRDEHGFHISTLPGDIALIGLAIDVEDAAGAALDLLGTARPH